MAEKKKRQDPAELSDGADFDMTPMIDVTFLLIIFFMLITELSDSSKAKLELPEAIKTEPIVHTPGRLVINVLEDGEIVVMSETLTEQQLDNRLRLEAVVSERDQFGYSGKAIFIRADRRTEFEHVQNVMALCMKHRLLKLAFATRDEPL